MYMNKHNQKTNCHAIYTYKNIYRSKTTLLTNNMIQNLPINVTYACASTFTIAKTQTHKDNDQHNVHYPLKKDLTEKHTKQATMLYSK